MTPVLRPTAGDRDFLAAIAVVATVREVDDPPAWAVDYAHRAIAAAREEGRAEVRERVEALADEWADDARGDTSEAGDVNRGHARRLRAAVGAHDEETTK